MDHMTVYLSTFSFFLKEKEISQISSLTPFEDSKTPVVVAVLRINTNNASEFTNNPGIVNAMQSES